MRRYTTLLFDLDGTLLDTLQDLFEAVNHALTAKGYPKRSLDEVRMFVGNGIQKLMERAVPEGTTAEDTDAALAEFRAYYKDHSRVHTAPYPGIPEVLKILSDRGYRMAVISNKIDSAVKALNEEFFSDTISVAIGDREGKRKKPAPDCLYEAMERLGVCKEECLYVGDSDVDVETADNTGIPCIGCAWGFRGREILRSHGLSDDRIIDMPQQLCDLIEALNSNLQSKN